MTRGSRYDRRPGCLRTVYTRAPHHRRRVTPGEEMGEPKQRTRTEGRFDPSSVVKCLSEKDDLREVSVHLRGVKSKSGETEGSRGAVVSKMLFRGVTPDEWVYRQEFGAP